YNQIIYTDTPAVNTIMHGTDTGAARGYLNDFYLYAVLFVTDNYPKDTGSCYVYYSDSLLIGFRESKGILIDPESGIYQATNSYGGTKHATYNPNTINHQFELLTELDPAYYAITPQDAETSSIGAAEFPQNNWNEQFLKDWNTLNEIYRPDSFSPVKAYRIEVIRRNGVSEIYINGIAVAALEDNIASWNEKNIRGPEKVSWTFGPILNEGGLTVTCAAGDFYLYGTGK
ncbi:MAG: hypothetical protein IKP86_01910, partial [Anaerolineaceae bacterium]|nr:hypothetical protein [Anaerolineaceae bacterium]